MLIEVSQDIFDDPQNERLLHKLWHTLEDRYEIILNDPTNSCWYKNLSGSYKSAVDLVISQSLHQTRTEADVIISQTSCSSKFSLEEAIKYLQQPVKVLLENSLNDGHFLNALLNNFKKRGKKIQKHKEKKWLNYEMGGGTTMRDVVEREKMDLPSDFSTKEKHKYLRLFALIDSDKRHPTQRLDTAKQNLVDFFIENEIKYHVLQKREIENYLPEEAFQSMLGSETSEETKTYIRAYLDLCPTQKDFFDIEKGFHKNANYSNDIKCLFSEVLSNKNHPLIQHDLSKAFNSNSRNKTFKSEFPKLFLSELVNQQGFLKRTEHQDDPEELQHILDKISGLL